MADPFLALRRPIVPLAPDREFARRLRGRLEQALTEGDAMTTSITDAPAAGTDHRDQVRHTLTPYLAVSPAREAIEWYVAVFGAELLGEPIVMPDRRIGHAELRFGDSVLMLADAHPEIGHTAPSDAGTPVMLTVQVSDAAATVGLAAEHGAHVDRPVADTPHGHRGGTIRDPFGHRWSVQSPLSASVTPPAGATARHGDLAYLSLNVPDAARAVRFYRSVLGWSAPPPVSGSTQVTGQSVSTGIWQGPALPGVDTPGVLLAWRVDDIEAAAEQVVAAGGTAGDVQQRAFGLLVDCLDDQGLAFALHQDVSGGSRPAPVSRHQGDVEYFTIGAPDEQAAAAFYGAVLGWRFRPGHVPHGLQIDGSTPVGGLWGGQPDRQRVQLMFRVDDVDAAVERVRRAGGRASEPEPMPYGRSADCEDDQGLRFWLLEPTG